MRNPFHLQTENYGILAILCAAHCGELCWGHIVRKLGSNPGLGKAAHCISLAGREYAEYFRSESCAAGLISGCCFWSVREGRGGRHAALGSDLLLTLSSFFSFLPSFSEFTCLGANLPSSCSVMQTVQVVLKSPLP